MFGSPDTEWSLPATDADAREASGRKGGERKRRPRAVVAECPGRGAGENDYGRETTYAAMLRMSSLVSLATTGFINCDHSVLRIPTFMSYIWRAR